MLTVATPVTPNRFGPVLTDDGYKIPNLSRPTMAILRQHMLGELYGWLTHFHPTVALDYPYGQAALLLAARAALWSIGDMERYHLTISPGTVEGPGLLLTSDRRVILIDRINLKRTEIRGRPFFIEDEDGNTIMSRLFWYHRDDRGAIVEFLRSVNTGSHLNLSDLFLET